MNEAKIQLSAEELQLVQDTTWVLTKNRIIQKAYVLLGNLSQRLQEVLASRGLPEALAAFSPKISRGENYKGLPYLVLDYPRIFARQDVFAIRTMMWWGNYFTVTLQLKGPSLEQYGPRVAERAQRLASQGFQLYRGEGEWIHEMDEDHYIPLRGLSATEVLNIARDQTFLKCTAKIGLSQWNESEKKLGDFYEVLADCLLP